MVNPSNCVTVHTTTNLEDAVFLNKLVQGVLIKKKKLNFQTRLHSKNIPVQILQWLQQPDHN